MTVDVEGLGEATLHAVSLSRTRDPFDRIITAQAAYRGATLLTRDQNIRANYANAVW